MILQFEIETNVLSLCLSTVVYNMYCREGRVMGVVEVSRSIGDGRFKHCGIISVPDVLRCQLTDNDRSFETDPLHFFRAI